jgi:RNA polymerase sigma-70 factor (ECF subfamily)
VLSDEEYARFLQPLLPQAAGYARSILRNRTDAEDAVQQAALRGLERLATFDTVRPFKAWWFAILRNCCLDVLRSKHNARTRSLDEEEAASVPAARRSDDWECLASAMNRLKPEHRDILRLRYFGGLTYHELAATLSLPEGTVMSRLYHAKRALAAIMRDEAR